MIAVLLYLTVGDSESNNPDDPKPQKNGHIRIVFLLFFLFSFLLFLFSSKIPGNNLILSGICNHINESYCTNLYVIKTTKLIVLILSFSGFLYECLGSANEKTKIKTFSRVIIFLLSLICFKIGIDWIDFDTTNTGNVFYFLRENPIKSLKYVGSLIFYIIPGIFISILIELGGYLIIFNKNTTLKRIEKSRFYPRKEIQNENDMIFSSVSKVISIFKSHNLFVRLVLVIAIVITPVMSVFITNEEYFLKRFVQLILLICITIIIYYLIRDWLEMIKPLDFDYSNRKTLDSDNLALNFACISRDIRLIYFFDAVHNSIIITTFWSFIINSLDANFLFSREIVNRNFILLLLTLTLVFAQVPYVIGQLSFNRKISERYGIMKWEKIKKEISEYAPLFPTFQVFASLTATGTAGGILYLLIDEFFKKQLGIGG